MRKGRSGGLDRRMKRDHLLTPPTKIKSKLVKDLNMRPETTKLQEEDIGGKLPHTGLVGDFMALTPKAKVMKANVSKWDDIKQKGFRTAEEAISKMKRRPSESEKKAASHVSDKGLKPQIYKEPTQLNGKNKQSN